MENLKNSNMQTRGILERFDDLICLIKDISNQTSALIKKHLEGTDPIAFPIKVEDLANELGITVVYDDLNLANTREENQLICEWEPGEEIRVERTVDLFTRRYAIAYAIGCYCLNSSITQKEAELDNHSQYCLPLLSTRKEELLADIYAVFLSIPLNLFFKEFTDYINNIRKTGTFPVSIDEWLGELSTKAQIPYFNVAKGYQYLSIVAYDYYKKNVVNKPASVQMENYVNLFM